MRVQGKIALITGGAGGIGAETARLLAREGAKVVITDLIDSVGQTLAAEIGGHFFQHDVADEGHWGRVAETVVGLHGRIDVLVNAAGIEGKNLAKLGGLNMPLEEWRRVMSVNLDGTFLGCRAVMPAMLAQGSGSIVNIASIVSAFATPTALAYGASKAAVQQLTRSLAQIGGSSGKHVRCNSVHPGIIKSRMTDDLIGEFAKLTNVSPAEAETMIVSGVLFAARGKPIDVANLILFLSSDESAYITGSAFEVDGGWHIVNAG